MFALRRRAILDQVNHWEPGRFLEMGCGSGALLCELGRLGFRGVGVEMSDRARELARQLTSRHPELEVLDSLPDGPFDYLFSFEVLEHIEDDAAALHDWVKRLRPGGRALLSVPAHQRKWNVTDTMAGHYRRYDREDTVRLVRSADLEIEGVTTYGFPASWLIEKLRLAATHARARKRGIDPARVQRGDRELTLESGIERTLESQLFPFYAGRIGCAAFSLAARVQLTFYPTDWGISFLVSARKPST
jgi:SAM-dependent methyltransferase